MKKRKESKDADSLFIESSLEIPTTSNPYEVEFVIYQDKNKVLTIKAYLEGIHSVIKKHIFEKAIGEVKYVEYDSDPNKGGKVISEDVFDIQNKVLNDDLKQVIDLWLLDSVFYVLRNLPNSF